MSQTVKPIDEEEDLRKRVIGRIELYYSYLDLQSSDPIHKKDLPAFKINELDRTFSAAQRAFGQTELASPSDRMRSEVSKQKLSGSNDVVKVAKSSGLVTKPMGSIFDLSSRLEKRRRSGENEESEASSKRPKTRDSTTAPSTNTHPHSPPPEMLQKLHQTLETLAPATSPPSTNRPVLEPPRQSPNPQPSYLYLILKMHEALEETVQSCADRLEAQINHDLRDLERLRKEKVDAVEKHAKELSEKESWSTLESMARYVTYASSLVGGLWLLHTGVGGAAGYLLIAAGGIGLGGSLAKDTGLIQSMAAYVDKSQETQKHVEQSIDFVITILPLGFALVGTALASPGHFPEALTWTGTALRASAALGSGVSANRMYARMAELEKSSTNILLIQKGTDASAKNMQETLELARYLTEQTAQIISSSEVQLS